MSMFRLHGRGATLSEWSGQKRCGPGVTAFAVAIGWLPAMASAASPPEPTRVHGLWVWHAASIIDSSAESAKLRAFALAQGVNHVYLSALSHGKFSDPHRLCSLIELLHASHIRSDALLSSTNADEPGPHRQRLLEEVDAVLHFDTEHPGCRFDGIHLDIEPQQRPENKGSDNRRFLPDLIATYAQVHSLAQAAGLTVDVDVAIKVLKAGLDERRALLQSVDRVTLMLYELNRDADGSSKQAADKLRTAVRAALAETYAGLAADSGLADIIIGLREQDYGESLPQMFQLLDSTFEQETRYGGWARHAYADSR